MQDPPEGLRAHAMQRAVLNNAHWLACGQARKRACEGTLRSRKCCFGNRYCAMILGANQSYRSTSPREPLECDVDTSSASNLPWLRCTDPSVFCAHLRLHPGITWSHTAGSPCDVPPLSHIGRKVSSLGRNSDQLRAPASYTRTATKDPPKTDSDQGRVMDHGRPMVAADFSLLTFARNEVTGEWNYPWDLTGGLYRCVEHQQLPSRTSDGDIGLL